MRTTAGGELTKSQLTLARKNKLESDVGGSATHRLTIAACNDLVVTPQLVVIGLQCLLFSFLRNPPVFPAVSGQLGQFEKPRRW